MKVCLSPLSRKGHDVVLRRERRSNPPDLSDINTLAKIENKRVLSHTLKKITDIILKNRKS
ncbi:MAG: hypothetical protein IJI42_11795 [Methanobrevibacter sp.]|nr:hypothetical protein [Methanobrevibacter sp.]